MANRRRRRRWAPRRLLDWSIENGRMDVAAMLLVAGGLDIILALQAERERVTLREAAAAFRKVREGRGALVFAPARA